MGGRRWSESLAGAALLVAGVTVLSRVVGFGRWLVFAASVKGTCLGSAYLTANALPNVVFEIVAGGALAGAVVPLVAAARERDGDVAGVVSALLTWAMVVLVPTSVLTLLLARPLMGALLLHHPSGCDGSQVVGVASSMFVLFAPQIALYGVAVVCSGVLQAHRRFLAAAVAPLVSSLAVVATYAAVGLGWSGDRNDLATLPDGVRLGLAAGTTAGVVALAAVVAVPLRSLQLGLRPTLRFPGASAGLARRLALSGVAGLVAQQVAVVVAVVVANADKGAIAVYNYAWAVYLLPYAVLAVPLATSVFPSLAASADRGDDRAYARVLAGSTRMVVITAGLGAAVLAGAGMPVARVFLHDADEAPSAWLGWALVAFAPGLPGYALLAHLGRACYARNDGRAVARAAVIGWGVAAVLSMLLGTLAVPHWRVAALGLSNTLGMSVAGALLMLTVRRRSGASSLEGVARAGLAAFAAAVGAAGAAAALGAAVPATGRLANAALACAAAGIAALVFTAVLACVDSADLRSLLDRVPRRRVPA